MFLVSRRTRHTKSFLQAQFAEMGIAPATRLGQNFLIDPNLQELIVDAAGIESDDVVLEVGTGTGALTQLVAERATAVISVEVDRHLFELAKEQLIDLQNVTLLRQDALHNKNQLEPSVLAMVRERLAQHNGPFKVVANLPYNVATPVISNLLAGNVYPCSMTITIQKELADRIVAAPSNKEYGALSVWIQSQADVQVVRILAPSVFWPRPKVDSAVIRIDVDDQRRSTIDDLQFFRQFTRALFLHRRKFLRANVVAALKRHLSKEQVDTILDELQLTGDVRTEQLDVATIQRLCARVRQDAPQWRL